MHLENSRSNFFVISYFTKLQRDNLLLILNIVIVCSSDVPFFQLFFALAIPLDDPESTMSVALFFEAEYKLPTNVIDIELPSEDGDDRIRRNIDRRMIINRTMIYTMLESKFESLVTL